MHGCPLQKTGFVGGGPLDELVPTATELVEMPVPELVATTAVPFVPTVTPFVAVTPVVTPFVPTEVPFVALVKLVDVWVPPEPPDPDVAV